MTSIKENSKKFSGLWCGQWKRPNAFTFNSIGHLTAAFLFNFLKIKCYDTERKIRFTPKC